MIHVRRMILFQESSQESSPTQTEKEFLMCANTTLTDELYYSSVPEDTTGLDHSLSSSLTSLCRQPSKTTHMVSSKLTPSGKCWCKNWKVNQV